MAEHAANHAGRRLGLLVAALVFLADQLTKWIVAGPFGLRAEGDRLDLLFYGTAVSDKDYLLDYGYGDEDRLESSVRLARVGETTLSTSIT